MMEHKDFSLINKAIQGDNEARGELYSRYYQPVYNTIFYITKNTSDAEDVAQETFIKAFNSLTQLDDAKKFGGWIKQIAANKAKDSLRKLKPMVFSDIAPEGDEDIRIDFEDEREEFVPDLAIDKKETTRLINEILMTLPDEQRTVITMFYYDQMSVGEIAESLSVSESAVKSRLQYGRKKIETNVLELEKKGTKLYSLLPIPFLLALLKKNDAFAAEITPFEKKTADKKTVVKTTVRKLATWQYFAIVLGVLVLFLGFFSVLNKTDNKDEDSIADTQESSVVTQTRPDTGNSVAAPEEDEKEETDPLSILVQEKDISRLPIRIDVERNGELDAQYFYQYNERGQITQFDAEHYAANQSFRNKHLKYYYDENHHCNKVIEIQKDGTEDEKISEFSYNKSIHVSPNIKDQRLDENKTRHIQNEITQQSDSIVSVIEYPPLYPGPISTTYDLRDGKLLHVSRISANDGQAEAYLIYNDKNRIKKVYYGDAGSGLNTIAHYIYDEKDRLISITAELADGVVTGRIPNEEGVSGAVWFSWNMGDTNYLTYPGAESIVINYDEQDRIKAVTILNYINTDVWRYVYQ